MQKDEFNWIRLKIKAEVKTHRSLSLVDYLFRLLFVIAG